MDSAPSTRKQQTHDRILDTAARVLRDGGFYAHFASREALLAEALERAGHDSELRLRQSVAAGEAKGMSPFAALVASYLSDKHLRTPEAGCPVAALASEMPRQAEAVREVAAERVRSLVAGVQACLPPGHDAETAAVVASQLAGALQLARTLGDNARGRKHLAAARRYLLEHFEPLRPTGR